MRVRQLQDSISAVWGEAADRDIVVHLLDAAGNLVAEKALAEIVFERGDSLLAPHDPPINQESKLIIKVVG